MQIRHGLKPGCHEAEALIHFSLEAEALVKKPKPGYLYSTNWLQSQSLVNHEAGAEAFENHEAEARLPKI